MYCPRKKAVKGCLNCKLPKYIYDSGGETLALPPNERREYLEKQKLRYKVRKERLKASEK